MKIVIVHEPGLMAAGVREALASDDGFEIVAEVRQSSQVLATVSQTRPDVVLLDARMGGYDGLTVLQRLILAYPEVKVVMCSMTPDPDQIQAAFKRGACGCILETIEPIDLGSAIRQAVEGTAYHALGLPAIDQETAVRSVGLTQRELEVLHAVARGLSNKEVAAELWVTVQTVKFHLTSIYRKLGASNRTEATRWALEKGLAEVTELEARDGP